MGYVALLLALILGTLAYGVFQFCRAKDKSRDAALAVAYVIAYPPLAWLVWHSEAGWWLAVPAITAGIPWVVAGIYLNEIVRDPSLARDKEFVGFPYGFWLWGGVLSIALGMLLD